MRIRFKGVSGTKVVRALIDSGSQRSYILQSTAKQLSYTPKYSQKIVHCLFGGKEAANTHNCYDVTIWHGRKIYTFEALDQLTICSDVAPVFHGPWTDDMNSLNLEISDDKNPGPIEILFGADVAGDLYTGERQKLNCGLFAIETRFGWTLMGKIPGTSSHSDVVMTTLNLFVKNASISELWDLDVIGIKEPSDKHSKDEMAIKAKEMFLETVTTDKEGRYEVKLPWLEDHPPLPTNYKLAQKHLFESRWWEGPQWLYEEPERWPCISIAIDEEEVLAERKKKLITTLVNTSESTDWHLDYFYNYHKIIRMIAWMFRFVYATYALK